MAVVLLVVGVFAVGATSGPEVFVTTSGSLVLNEGQSVVLDIEVDAKSDDVHRVNRSLTWQASSETGVHPRLSVVTVDPFPTATLRLQVSDDRLELLDPRSTIEFAVANQKDTGAVTIEWDLAALGDGSNNEDDLHVSVSEAMRASASPMVLLPAPSFAGPSVYRLSAAVGADSQSDGLRITSSGKRPIGIEVDGTALTATADRPLLVPWPVRCGDVCELTVLVALTASAEVSIDAGRPDGSVLAVIEAPQQTATSLTLLPVDVSSDDQVYVFEVTRVDGPAPLDGLATVTAEFTNEIARGFDCFLPVVLLGGGHDGPMASGGASRSVATIRTLPGTSTVIELHVVTGDASERCEIDPAVPLELEVSVITYGFVSPPELTLSRP